MNPTRVIQVESSDDPRSHPRNDPRLSAFGGITLGLKGQMNWNKWIFDAKYDYYTQRSSLRIGGEGSPNLGEFKASFFQVGFARRF